MSLYKRMPFKIKFLTKIYNSPYGKPVKIKPTKNKSTKNKPTKNKSTKITPTQITPAQINPAQITPAQITPAQITPAQINPAQITPANNTPKILPKIIPKIIPKKNSIIVHPTGGLCNKLRVTLSYLDFARRNNTHLVVIWKKSSACPGYFLDYFQPMNGVSFQNSNFNNKSVMYEGCYTKPEFKNWNIYKELKLVPELERKIQTYQKTLGRYIAVHIRRTDHVRLAKKTNSFTSDQEFIRFIRRHPDYNLYLATDNSNTQDKFLKLFPDKIKVIENIITKNNSLRQTSLEQAIIDLIVCSRANKFKGSGASSFSSFIERLRDLSLN